MIYFFKLDKIWIQKLLENYEIIKCLLVNFFIRFNHISLHPYTLTTNKHTKPSTKQIILSHFKHIEMLPYKMLFLSLALSWVLYSYCLLMTSLGKFITSWCFNKSYNTYWHRYFHIQSSPLIDANCSLKCCKLVVPWLLKQILIFNFLYRAHNFTAFIQKVAKCDENNKHCWLHYHTTRAAGQHGWACKHCLTCAHTANHWFARELWSFAYIDILWEGQSIKSSISGTVSSRGWLYQFRFKLLILTWNNVKELACEVIG
jgi:hypothetical protein